MNQDYNSYNYISTCSIAGVTTAVTTSACVLKGIFIPPALVTTYTVGVVDATSGSTVNVASITASTTTATWALINCGIGAALRIVTTGSAKITPSVTIVYRQ